MSFFSFLMDIIGAYPKTLLGAAGGLCIALITIRHQETTKKRDKFAAEYLEFKETFTDLIKCLEGDSSLNVVLLQEYPSQRDARRRFLHNLKGSRLANFTKKWAEYEEYYNDVKNMGPFGVVCAIAPSLEALNSNPNPIEISAWEFKRKREIHVIISDLLNIANKKIWV